MIVLEIMFRIFIIFSFFIGINRVCVNIVMIFLNRFFYGWLMMNGLVLDFFKIFLCNISFEILKVDIEFGYRVIFIVKYFFICILILNGGFVVLM